MSDTPANDRLLRALRRQPVDRTPVWLMRQAGRYLPEYRASRAAAGSFLAMAKTPELACEVTLQPLRRFPLDAAILFSDILTVPDAMGLGLYFVEGEGPKFERPVRSEEDVARLAVPDMETGLRYVMDAIRVIRRELGGSVPLIGFSGSPWTLACYMVEGGGSDNYSKIKAMAFDRPELLHRMLGVVTDAVIAYLSAQRAAGAQALQVFDTWGGVLSPSLYREFSLPYLQRIARATFDDDPRVEWVLGDGSEWLREAVARPERFDVVFADTWPGKYHDRDLAMELVKPHGWFVLDDLYPQPGWPDGHQANVDRLIADMQSVDGWRTEFLPWGSGLMLCVRD